jgi:hypothetical protein
MVRLLFSHALANIALANIATLGFNHVVVNVATILFNHVPFNHVLANVATNWNAYLAACQAPLVGRLL